MTLDNFHELAPVRSARVTSTITGMGVVVVHDDTHFLCSRPNEDLIIWKMGYDEVKCPKNWVLV